MNRNKEIYKQLCQTEGSHIPLFLQYWWMEAVCEGKEWDVALAYDKGCGSDTASPMVRGALPYLIGKRLGMRYVLQPQLTQYNGPWYNYSLLRKRHVDYCENQRLNFEREVADQLVDHIDELHLAYYQQNFAPSVTNWLPYFWKEFSQTTRYTYRISDISNPQMVFDHFDPAKRQRPIRKAEQVLHLDASLTPSQFAAFHNQYWQSRGCRDLLSADFIIRVCTIAVQRGQGMILSLRDDMESLQAARFVVWDDQCAYSLLSALCPEGHLNGASPLLFWHILQRLVPHTKAFDFEGSMDSGIEYSYRLYGACQTPYFQITRCNSWLFSQLLKLKH